MKIKDLVNNKPIVIKVLERELPKFSTPYGKYGPFSMPLYMMVTNLFTYGSKFVQCYGYDLEDAKAKKTLYTLPVGFKDFTLNLSKKMKPIAEKAILEFTLKSLATLIGNKMPLGSDPEIFVENKKKELIPAFHFLGSKEKPNKVNETLGGGWNGNKKAIYWDGYQAEFVTTSESCLSYHVDSIYAGLKGVSELAKVHDKTARLSSKTVFDIPEESLKKDKDEHVQFGCMPSYNNYNLSGIKSDGRVTEYRSAGGHIHFGCGKRSPDRIESIVYALDSILGVACVAMFAKFDDPRRRRMYGLAGEYRLPPHGLEYRVLSNAWMFHPLITNFVFDLARKCFNIGDAGILDSIWKATKEETIDCINNCDVEKAQEILDRNKETFMTILDACYGTSDKSLTEIFKGFRNGMETIIEAPTNIEENWCLAEGQKWQMHNEYFDKSWRSAQNTVGKGKKAA